MNPDHNEADSLASTLLAADSGVAFRRARRALEARGREQVVEALIRAMHKAADQRVFDRSAKLLAEYGGDRAAQALAFEARSQRQYPRLAIRAFALCDHPTVVPVLLDLLAYGRMKQRRASAFALARLRSPQAVEPLCIAAARGSRDIGPEATEALRTFGRADQIARLVLGEPGFSPADHVRILQTIQSSPIREGFWRTSPFDPARFLEREAGNPRSPLRQQALSAAEFLHHQSTLLRGVEPAAPDRLLRAVATPGNAAPDSLLRASSGFSDSRPGASAAPFSWFRRLVAFLLRLAARR